MDSREGKKNFPQPFLLSPIYSCTYTFQPGTCNHFPSHAFDSWHEFWLVIKTSGDLRGNQSSRVMAVPRSAQHQAQCQIDLTKRYSGTTSLTPFAAAASFLTWLKKCIIGKYGKSITRKWKGWDECSWLGCNGNGSLCNFCWPFTETSRESDVRKGHGPPSSKQWCLSVWAL